MNHPRVIDHRPVQLPSIPQRYLRRQRWRQSLFSSMPSTYEPDRPILVLDRNAPMRILVASGQVV